MTRLHRWFASQRDLRRRLRYLEADNDGLRIQVRKLETDLWWALDAAACVDPTRHIRLAHELEQAKARLAEQTGADPHRASLQMETS